MKKSAALLLALALCLTALLPASAEGIGSIFDTFPLTAPPEVVEAFPFTATVFRSYFDRVVRVYTGQVTVWEVVDGQHVVTVPGYGDVYIATNAEGCVTSLSASLELSASSDYDAAVDSFSTLVGLIAMGTRSVGNLRFLQTVDAAAYAQEVNAILEQLTPRVLAAMYGPVSASGEVAGDTVTFTLALDIARQNVIFTFIYEP